MQGSDVRYLVVHCAATKPSMDIGAVEIDQWHKQNGWSGIGYALVIRRNGIIEPGRPLDQSMLPGWQIKEEAQVGGHNHESVGICLVGGLDEAGKPANRFTDEQWDSLEWTIEFLTRCFPAAAVVGHRDLDPGKACPCFDVKAWWAQENDEVHS